MELNLAQSSQMELQDPVINCDGAAGLIFLGSCDKYKYGEEESLKPTPVIQI